jgi:hypothetical protein
MNGMEEYDVTERTCVNSNSTADTRPIKVDICFENIFSCEEKRCCAGEKKGGGVILGMQCTRGSTRSVGKNERTRKGKQQNIIHASASPRHEYCRVHCVSFLSQ